MAYVILTDGRDTLLQSDNTVSENRLSIGDATADASRNSWTVSSSNDREIAPLESTIVGAASDKESAAVSMETVDRKSITHGEVKTEQRVPVMVRNQL